MTPEQFLAFADPLPEPTLLVSSDGTILAGNCAVEERLCIALKELRGKRLSEVVADSSVDVGHYLRACSRNRKFVLGSLAVIGNDGTTVNCRAEGALLRPRSGGNEPLLTIRLIPKESAIGQFVALNQRILDLGKEIQRRKQAELAAREEEERLRVTLHSIGDAVIVTDAEGRVNAMNPVAEALTAWTGKDASGQPLETVFNIVNETTRQAVENPALRALRDGVIVGLANHTILIGKDGTERPIDDSAAPIRARPDEVIGSVLVFRDISEKKRAEAALRMSEGRFRELANAMPQMVWAARPDGFIDYYNERWYEFTQMEKELYGQGSWEPILHPDDVQRCNQVYYECIRDGRPYQIEYRFKDRTNGGYRWFLGRAVPVRDDEGRIIRWFGTCTDIDDTKRSQQSSDFLADASGALADLNDLDSTLQKVAGIAVPTFADWCVVDLYEGGERKRVASTHADPAKVQLAKQLVERYPPKLSEANGVGYVIRTGKPELVEEIPESLLAQGAHDEEHLRALNELGLRSYICVPMLLRGKLRGVLTFVMAESGRRFKVPDLRVAQELASRAAVAIENANLYRALQEEDRRKDEFLATLAHELRNPLAPIRNGLQLIQLAGNDTEVTTEAVRMMERQLGQMIHIIDDLLDVSRISRGKLKLRKERVRLDAVVNSALETCDPILKQSGHELAVTLPETPVLVDADPTRLAQVLCNLLNNAAKYTEAGGRIWLDVQQHPDEAVISVKDTGVGIPPPMLPKVFEMFTQVDRSLEKSQGGLGIGLTIVKRLVELHGGSIEAHSKGHGQGSEFVVRLPVVQGSVPQPSETAVRRSGGPASRHRVLVVDDNVDAAGSLASMLRLMDNEVQVAHDGLQGVEAAEAFRPDMILLDIGMPKLNGYEACRRIRQQEWAQGLTVVALTGWGQEEDKQRSREAGFDYHLVKPADPSEIERLLSLLKPYPS